MYRPLANILLVLYLTVIVFDKFQFGTECLLDRQKCPCYVLRDSFANLSDHVY